MHAAILAALGATVGFAGGDVFTALVARKVSGKASMLLLTALKLVLYAPFIILWHHEFVGVSGLTLAWIVVLGVLFTAAYLGFNMGMQLSKSPALVGVVAGCFPASASLVAIVFLGQQPSPVTIVLLLAVLGGVILIGLPDRWRLNAQFDRGLALALIPLVCWGIFGALLHEPVNQLNTPHAWFVVQSLVAVIMNSCTLTIYNRHIPGIVVQTWRKKALGYALIAGTIIGIAEAAQAFSLGSGRELVIVEALLGSYPAVYFLIAHRIFKEPLHRRQWIGIIVVAVCIAVLSISA